MSPRNRLPARAGSTKRLVTWIGPADQAFLAVAANTKVLLASFDAEAAFLNRPTIVRTRGAVDHAPTVVSADVNYIGAFGMAVVSDQAFGIGITAIPGPFSNADWDGWFVWRSFSYSYAFDSAISARSVQETMEIDSKAMRKVSVNETIVLVVESQSGAFSISVPVRMLLKLS